MNLDEITKERMAQDKKWGEQNHHPVGWLAILMEEVGEASKAALTKDFTLYRLEMIQVAAVAVAMVECLDRGIWNKKQETPHVVTEEPCDKP